MTTAEKMVLAQALVKEFALDKKPADEVDAIDWCVTGIDKILAAYNDLKGTDAPAKDVGEVYKHAESLRDVYNSASREKHHKDIKQQSDSMMYAIRNPYYKIVKLKHGKKNDDFKEIREMADKRVDLLKLHDFCKGSFGAEKSWTSTLHKAWLAFQARGVLETVSEEISPDEIKAVKAGKKMSDEKAKQEIIGERFTVALKDFEQCDFVKEVDNKYQRGISLLSNGKLEEFLVNTVKAMIGDSEETKAYMPRLRDVRYVLKVYSKRSRKEENAVEYVKEREFSDIVMDILRCKVCGVEYSDIVKTK